MVEQNRSDSLTVARASWGAVFAGFVTVVAVQVTLSLLGVGIGMGTLGASGAEMARGVGIGSLAWMAGTSIIAFFIGGWISGRLSAARVSSSASLHGILVWGLTSMITLFLLTSAVGSLLGGTFGVLTNMAGAVINQLTPEQRNQINSQGQQMMGMKQQGPQASTRAGMGGTVSVIPSEVGAMMNKLVTQGAAAVTPQEKEEAITALANSGNMSREQAESAVNRMMQTAAGAQQQAGAAAKAGAAVGLSGFVLMALTALSSAWGAAAGRIRITEGG